MGTIRAKRTHFTFYTTVPTVSGLCLDNIALNVDVLRVIPFLTFSHGFRDSSLSRLPPFGDIGRLIFGRHKLSLLSHTESVSLLLIMFSSWSIPDTFYSITACQELRF